MCQIRCKALFSCVRPQHARHKTTAGKMSTDERTRHKNVDYPQVTIPSGIHTHAHAHTYAQPKLPTQIAVQSSTTYAHLIRTPLHHVIAVMCTKHTIILYLICTRKTTTNTD